MASGKTSAPNTPTMKSDPGTFPIRRSSSALRADSSALSVRDHTSNTDAEVQPSNRKGFNSLGAPMPPWLTELPCVLYAAAMLLFGEMVRADDDFPTSMRKVILSAGSLLVIPVSTIIVYNVMSIDDLSTPAGVVATVSSAPIAIGWTGVYVYARLTGRATALLGDLWLVCTQLCIVTQLISNPDFECHFATTTISMVALLLHTPRLPLHMAAFALLMLGGMYNDSAMERSMPLHLPLLMLPNPVLRGPMTRMFLCVCQASAFFIIYVGLYLFAVSAEASRKRAGDAAFARAMAQVLGRYDTMAAQEIISEAEGELAMSAAATSADEGSAMESQAVDEELVATFRVLTANLDKFRPHIPNWLMDQVKEDEEQRQAAANREVEQLLTNRSGDLRGGPSTEDGRSISMSDRAISSVGSDGGEPHAEFGKSPRTPKTPGAGGPSIRKFGQVPSTVSSSDGDGKDGPNVANAQFLMPGLMTTRPGAMVRMNFRALNTGPTRCSSAEVVDALHALVDGAHELAHSSKAALHGFVGDELVVTWNAASRAVQPEAKAMRFLWRLRAMLSRRAGDVLSVTGAGMAGPMQVLLAGQGRTQALTVSSRWQSSLDVLYRAAQEAGTVLVDRGLHSAASYACRARLVAAVQVAPPPDSAGKRRFSSTSPMLPNAPAAGSASPLVPAVVYGSQVLSPTSGRCLAAMELTGEVDDTKGEWMYVLKQNADTAGASQSPKQDQRSRDTDAAWSTVAGVVEDIIKGNDDVFESNAGRIHVLASAAADDGGSVGTNRTLCWAIGLLCAIADSRASI